MSAPSFVELSRGGESVRLRGDTLAGDSGLVVASGGIEGWWGTPEAKVSLTERGMGHGAHPVSDHDVLYSARTVTLHVAALAPTRDAAVSLAAGLEAMAGSVVGVRVCDSGSDTEATGYLRTEWQAEWTGGRLEGTATLVCPDPRRYGTARRGLMSPGAAGTQGGLAWPGTTGEPALAWPLSWGEVPELANACTVRNMGTATAYPTITVSGLLAEGLVVSHGGGQLAYSRRVSWGAPLVLDSLTRTATVNGVDVTRYMTRRDFPSVPPGGSLSLSLLATGDGSCEALVRDTYI